MNFKKILIFVLIVGFLASGYQIAKRISHEQRNRVVEIVADLDAFEGLSKSAGITLEDASKRLQNAGATSIAVSEATLSSLLEKGKVTLYEKGEIKHNKINNSYLQDNINNYITSNNLNYENLILIIAEDEAIYNFVYNGLDKRYPKCVYALNNGGYAVLLQDKDGRAKNIGIGILEEDYIKAKSLGFMQIVPRIENYTNLTQEEIDKIYDQAKQYKAKTVIFGGTQVLGYDSTDKDEEKLKYIGEKFTKKGEELVTAIIEKPSDTPLETVQRGIKSLAKYSDYINTKVYSIDEAQMGRLKPNDVVDQWGRAISQRNVRVIYVRPFTHDYKSYGENFENSLKCIASIKERVNHMGMATGQAKALGTIGQNSVLQFLMALAVMAGILLIILYFINSRKLVYALTVLGVIALLIIYFVPVIHENFGDLFNKLIAFASACTFPSLAAIYLIEMYKKLENNEDKLKTFAIIRKSVKTLIIVALIAGVGGVIVGAILSDSKYILKIDTFRGVKLSFVLPLLFFIGAFVIKLGLFKDKNGKPLNLMLQFNKLINTTVTVKYIIALVVVLGAIIVVVLRSGNTLVTSVSAIELAFRNMLEQYLVARPRTKELIALPILMLTFYSAYYKKKEIYFIMVLIGMLGIEDIVNSFCHLRMPVLVTTLSTTYSLIFAIIVGSIVIVCVEKFLKAYWNKRLQK